MKLSNILVGLTLVLFIGCTTNKSDKEHGHSHDSDSHLHPRDETEDDHTHEHDAIPQQEEFTISGDSVEVIKEPTHHTHDDGSTHHNH